MKNNLFSYATSELSQDAFICWLVSFAFKDVDCDAGLQECAHNLLSLFVPEFGNDEATLVEINRQVGNAKDGYIDILLTVSYGERVYKIIVEDKTYSDDHDNQLARYVMKIKADYPEAEVRGVYYKTGFQSNLSKVVEAKYQIVDRATILALMEKYITKTNNSIFGDYYEYWNAFHKETEEYATNCVGEWNWKQINGCYTKLKDSGLFKEENLGADFGYVANPTGGFHGLWASVDDARINVNGLDFELYLQLETYEKTDERPETMMQLCLKLSVNGEVTDFVAIREGRDAIAYVHEGNTWTYALKEYGFNKPKRIGSGRHMTIGVYNTTFTKYEDVKSAFTLAVQKYKELLAFLRMRES